jgi:hypothetical protein
MATPSKKIERIINDDCPSNKNWTLSVDKPLKEEK